MLRYVKDHWVAALLVVMFATSTIFTWQKAEQIDSNTSKVDQQQVIFNTATCTLRDATNDQLDAIERLRAATQAAVEVAAAPGGASTPERQAEFEQLAQDASNISIEPVTVPPDVVCDATPPA